MCVKEGGGRDAFVRGAIEFIWSAGRGGYCLEMCVASSGCWKPEVGAELCCGAKNERGLSRCCYHLGDTKP